MPVARVNAVEVPPRRASSIAAPARVLQLACVVPWLALALAAQAQVTTASGAGPQGPAPGQGATQVPIAPDVESASATVARRSGKEGAPPRSYSFKPTFDSVLSLVNTSGQNGVADSTDLVLQIRPGFEATSRSGRVRGQAIYYADASARSSDNSRLRWRNFLEAKGSAEVVPNWMYTDMRAGIAQLARDVEGQQSRAGAQSLVDNIVEVGTVSVSPYLRGDLGELARYEARWTGEATNVRKSKRGDFTNSGVLLRLTSPSAAGLGWLLEGTKKHTVFRVGRTTDEERLIAGLSLTPSPDLSVGVRGGRESANVADVDARSLANWGASLKWAPSRRTGLAIDYDKRYFGQSYRAAFEYREGLSSILFNASRNTNNNQLNTGGAVTIYDLLFLTYATLYPDPIVRDAFVRDRLRAANVDPNTVASGGFVSSGVSVLRSVDLGWVYTTRRTTYTLQAFSTGTSGLGAVVANINDGTEVRESGFNATALHRLTPTSTGIASLSVTRTQGRNGLRDTVLQNFSLRVTNNVNRYTDLTLGTRLSLFDSPTQPYREAALSAILVMRF
jgi:uncharacterized protein (PEP-CTERM system associated)